MTNLQGLKGAMTFAEGRYDYKVSADIVFNNGINKKDFVLRTCYENHSVWKTKYSANESPFKSFIKGAMREASIIDREMWVFGIDATNSHDIVAAVNIFTNVFEVRPEAIIGDIYVKNLNAEGEIKMNPDVLIEVNKNLYEKTCSAIKEAAIQLGCNQDINFWVFSNNKNPKIPGDALRSALLSGGAKSVHSEDFIHRFKSGKNDGSPGPKLKTNLHLAKIEL